MKLWPWLFWCLLPSLADGACPGPAEAGGGSSSSDNNPELPFSRPGPGGSAGKKEAALPETVKRIAHLNSLSSSDNITAFYGINQFSHLYPEEFKATYLQSRPFKVPKYTPGVRLEGTETPLPAKFDWRDQNVVTQVRNQEMCGGCWAFSVVSGIESAYAIKGKVLEELSVQQVIDCSYNNNGCQGGSTVSALSWLNQTRLKLVRDSEYPFKAEAGLCHFFSRSVFGVSIKDYVACDFSGREDEMMKVLVEQGPLAVIVDAVSWQDYLGGIIQYHCSSGEANHAVVITGFDRTGLLEKARLYLTRKPLPSLEERKKYDYEFATSTSFHGVHNIVRTKSKTHKTLWMLVVMGSIIVVAWQICNRFINYFSWPTTTSVVVQYVEKIEFPAVTFCNLNRFQTQAVANLGIIFFLWSIVSGVLHFFDTDNKFGQELTDFLQWNQNFSIKEFTRNNGFFLNNATLLDCEYFGKPCYPKDFEHVFTEYGNCFTFNHINIPAKRRVSVSGRGLSLLFDVNQDKFTDDPALGFVDAGITFAIHSPKEPPRFDGLGVSTPVGMHAHAAIRQVKTIIQEHPWGECNPNIKLRHHKIYSTYGCLQECKAQQIQKQCDCVPFMLPGYGPECDLEKFYNCVSPILYNIELMGSCSVGTYNSTCPVPCEETDYPTTVSYSTFASEKASKFLSTKLKKSPEYIRNNFVYIDIKYHDLNYKMTQQQKALSISELLADVGGQLGLFCGASMITIIEVVEYIFANFCWMCVFLLLKAPEMPNWNASDQNQQTHKRRIQEC